MKKTINNIEIEYQKESQNFIDELIEYLLTQIEEIFNFFNYTKKTYKNKDCTFYR